MGFDPILNSKINEILESGGAGHAEYTSTHIWYSGDPTGKATFEGELLETSGTFVHVSDEVITGGTLRSVECRSEANNDLPTSNLQTVCTSDGMWLLLGTVMTLDRILAVSLPSSVASPIGIPAGTYFWTETVSGAYCFITEINGNLTETIHPIDPKYLPGVCLPVVELSTTWANTQSLTAEENAKLKAAWENDTPIIVKCSIVLANGGWEYSSAVWYRASKGAMSAFVLGLGTSTLLIFSMDKGETWGCIVG